MAEIEEGTPPAIAEKIPGAHFELVRRYPQDERFDGPPSRNCYRITPDSLSVEAELAEQAVGWDKELPGCMPGSFTAPFGLHPNDRRRALAWADSLQQRGLKWPDAQVQIEAYLRSINTSPQDIAKQIERARSLIAHRM